MPTSTSIQELTTRLGHELQGAYGPDTTAQPAGTQPLRDAFTGYARDAARAGVSLEDAMAAGVDALQGLFERVGGHASDPATMLAAGIALAAIARAYHSDGCEDGAAAPEPALPSQVARLSALHRINQAATANLKLSEMLETTVRVVAEATGSDACAVFLHDAPTGSLALRAAVGLNPASVGAVTLRPGYGITGRAAAEGRTIAAPDAHAHPAFMPLASIGEDVYASQVSVPMLLRGGGDDVRPGVANDGDRLVGVLNILTVDRREFDDEEITFLRTVAGELAISIENARLYSRTDARLRRKVAELGTLQRVSRCPFAPQGGRVGHPPARLSHHCLHAGPAPRVAPDRRAGG